MEINQLQNFDQLCAYSQQFSEEEFLQMTSDFHFLLFLLTNQTYHIPMADLLPLLSAIRNESGLSDVEVRDVALLWSRSQTWGELAHLIREQTAANPHGGNSAMGAAERAARWACQVCTLENSEDRQDCEACGIPRN